MATTIDMLSESQGEGRLIFRGAFCCCYTVACRGIGPQAPMTNSTINHHKDGSEQNPVTLPPTLFLSRKLLFNREASWLEFNRRVLEEALDSSQPLLERVKFLSIFSTNLDEFFMIRVSGLKEQIDEGVTELSLDGLTPTAQLKQINELLRPMVAEQVRCFNEEILIELGNHGIVISPYRALSDRERRMLSTYFMENVFPVLTPQAVDPSHPFPYISNLSLNLGVMIEPDGEVADATGVSAPRFARVKVVEAAAKPGTGHLEIHFSSLDELDALIARLDRHG